MSRQDLPMYSPCDRRFRRLGRLALCAMLAGAVLLSAGCEQWGMQPEPVVAPKKLNPVPPHEFIPPPEPVVVAADPEPVIEPVPTPPPPAAPKIRIVHLGDSVGGKPLVMHVFGEGEDTTFVFGGIHGNEPTSAYVAQRLLGYLSDHRELFRDRRVAVLGRANPDGLARGTRGNAHGVDLNRNFPATNFRPSARYGLKPTSEPETRAILSAMETLRPQRVVAIHSTVRGRHCNNYDGPAGELAKAMHACNGYRVTPVWGAPTPGSFGTWSGIDRKIPTITLELPKDLSGPRCWATNRDALVAVIRAGRVGLAK